MPSQRNCPRFDVQYVPHRTDGSRNHRGRSEDEGCFPATPTKVNVGSGEGYAYVETGRRVYLSSGHDRGTAGH